MARGHAIARKCSTEQGLIEMNGWRSCTVAHWLSSSSDSSAPPLGRRVTRYPLRPNRKRAKIDVVTSRMILVAALAACTYPTHFEDCTVRCAADAECPNDLACGPEGLCRTPGAEETCARVLGTFPSCAGLAPTCGPNADEDCCSTALPIPGGTFYRDRKSTRLNSSHQLISYDVLCLK